jgi:hypothetical protein
MGAAGQAASLTQGEVGSGSLGEISYACRRVAATSPGLSQSEDDPLSAGKEVIMSLSRRRHTRPESPRTLLCGGQLVEGIKQDDSETVDEALASKWVTRLYR